MREIRIAGAGPSGLAAAIVLARNGANVSVFEQNSCHVKSLKIFPFQFF